MNFFEHQDAARRNTKYLVVLYFAAVILIIALISIAVSALVTVMEQQHSQGLHDGIALGLASFWRPEIVSAVALCTLLVIALGTAWKLYMLRGGGKVVAESLGGTLLHPNTTQPDEQKLLNVVEEMALAAGMSVPPVYLLANESGINAFAAGHTPADAVIGVTKGCVEQLSRDELQGVIAHEFSHIFNGDMRLNLRLIGILNGILVIALTGYLLLRVTSRTYGRRYSSKRGGDPRIPLFLLGAVLYCFGYIGVFFGRLIKSAVSRQREFLADASAVQFTRYPAGLAGALAKIGGLSSGSKLEASNAEEASHLFFSNGLSNLYHGMFSTHPPLDQRIRRIDPSFKASFTAAGSSQRTEATADALHSGLAPSAGGRTAAASLQPTPQQVKASIGAPTQEHLRYIKDLLRSLPDQIRDATHDPYSAGALVFALLLDADRQTNNAQLTLISKRCDGHVLQEVLRLEKPVRSLAPEAKLPVVDMCVPALKELTSGQLEEFEGCLQALIVADNKMSIFEYALAHSVMSSLEWAFGKRKKPVPCSSIAACSTELSQILSALAWLHTKDEATAQRIFTAGTTALSVPLTLRPKASENLQQLDTALHRISSAPLKLREKILEACIAILLYDNRISAPESELLRAISSTLNCPMPPIL